MSERPWSLETLLTHGTSLALDSNVLIYLLNGDGPRAAAAGEIVDAVGDGRIVGILSTIGLSEVLAGPARFGDPAQFERIAGELADLGLRIRPLDAGIAADAAWLRADGLGLEDAVHVATARAERATVFVTNDRRIRSRIGLEVVYLDDILGDPPEARPAGPVP